MTDTDLFASTLEPLSDRQKADVMALLLLSLDSNNELQEVVETYQAAIDLKEVWDRLSTVDRYTLLNSIR